MDEREQVQGQDQAMQGQGQEDTQWTWINVYDWQVDEHVNSETGEPFWSVKLASGTQIEVDGQKVDVGKYQLTMDWEPAVTRGEPGTPKCTRGLHFPSGWDITLRRVENVAKPDHEPIFEVTDKIEKVTPQQLADGVAERNNQWRAAHRKPAQEQEAGKESQEQKQPGRGITATKPREAEPAL